jgi:hypothetical protein
MTTTRRGALRLVAIGLALSLAAATGAASASPTTITREQAPAVAKAINLRPGDLPGYSPKPNPVTAQTIQQDKKFNTCDRGVQDSTALTVLPSPLFRNASTVIVSEVEVMPSAALVTKDLAAVTSARGLSCFNSQAVATFTAGGLPKHETVTARSTLLSLPAIGSLHPFGVRTISFLHTSSGGTEVTVPLYADEIGVGDGQLELVVTDVPLQGIPSSALEDRLLALLVARARAAVG